MHELLAQVLVRYGGIDAFIARLHVLLDTPTVVRPGQAQAGSNWMRRLRIGDPARRSYAVIRNFAAVTASPWSTSRRRPRRGRRE
ncbi:hypothetical protein [Nocardia sp. NPDC059228]|uniref:hypothetical protein n=1 Tax=Nocardia sp. NPDC059228 TaxID=3346777 RepID=UPI0036BDBE42